MNSTIDAHLQVVNRDELIERMMGSVPMAERMLRRFVEAAAGEYDDLESLLRSGDRSEVVALAHRHKGTAKTLSAERVAYLATELESRAADDSTAELLSLLDQIRSMHHEVEEFLERGSLSRPRRQASPRREESGTSGGAT